MLCKVLLLAVISLAGNISCFPESRVVNGTDTDVRNYPFIVSLRSASGSHSCGASIVAPRWILTAAHCVSGRSASTMTIQYATTKISANGEYVVGVRRFIIHEDYSPARAHPNDIALLELKYPLTYNYETLAPVTLPDPYHEISQTPEGAPGVLAGWGFNATGGHMQSNLQKANLKIYSDKECKERHYGATTTDHICAGVDEGGKGQCTRDSGGPLLYNDSIQLGIVSWSVKPCAMAPYPGVYTKVSHYIGWINDHTN